MSQIRRDDDTQDDYGRADAMPPEACDVAMTREKNRFDPAELAGAFGDLGTLMRKRPTASWC